MSPTLSRRLARLEASPVREILRVASGASDLVSLAGGLPAETSFPDLPGLPRGWMQYGTTEGEGPLREEIAALVRSRGLECGADQVLVLNGSQQGLDLAAKLLVDEGTPLLCEDPTYVAALQVFRLLGADLRGFPLGPEGPEPEALAAAFASHRPTAAYVIPSFQNPTGTLWSAENRARFAALSDRHGTVVLEDDPYGEIHFDGAPPPPVCSLLGSASWIHLGSFSKSFVPGLRMGFLVCSRDLAVPLERLKQASDLHSNRLSQALVLADLRDPARADRLAGLRSTYRQRRDAFAAALRKHLPGAIWELPRGGLFFWVRLDADIDLRVLAARAIARGVAFLPGEHCHLDGSRRGWMRLNFSHASPEVAEEGLRRLAATLASEGAECP